jgi:hypothetical protein
MYADAATVRDARAQYFAANGFSDATYSDDWVRFHLGPIPIAFPNTASRKRAIPMHDLHHVATGYDTTLRGEAEIGAWEIAAGCTDHWAAWVLNASAFAYGLVLAPRRVYAAFLRGRHSRTLYHEGWDAALLELRVAELRQRLRLPDAPARATWRDRAAFVGWVMLVTLPITGAVALTIRVLSSDNEPQSTRTGRSGSGGRA